MDTAQLELQLVRIAELQAELKCVLQDDTLERLEARTEELGSRIGTLIRACENTVPQPQPYVAQLEHILLVQNALVALVQHKVQVTGTQVAKAKASRAAALRYAVEPARTEISLTPLTDISG